MSWTLGSYGLPLVRQDLLNFGNAPMVAIVDLVSQEPWADRLRYVLSHQGIWFARTDHQGGVQGIITYKSERGGGTAFPPFVDLFALQLRGPDGFELSLQDAKTTVRLIGEWVDSGSIPG